MLKIIKEKGGISIQTDIDNAYDFIEEFVPILRNFCRLETNDKISDLLNLQYDILLTIDKHKKSIKTFTTKENGTN